MNDRTTDTAGAPITSCSASLRIEGVASDPLDFDQVERELCVTPTRVMRCGEGLLRRDKTASTDVWVYRAEVKGDRPLADHLDALKEKLDPHAEALRAIASKWKASIYCDYFSDLGQAYISIPSSLTKMFADYGVELVIYIFSWGGIIRNAGDEDENDESQEGQIGVDVDM